jgi:cytochrome b pre-mRNA-processing protein 3
MSGNANSMKLIKWLWPSNPARSNAAKLYGAIVAQARLPVFYAGMGVPDRLEGRFVVLAVHLFAVLHRLKAGDAAARSTAQELVDLFTADMETVLREVGVGDLGIPKKMRALSAANRSFVIGLDRAFGESRQESLTEAIAEALPLPSGDAETPARALSAYLRAEVENLAAQPVAQVSAGWISFTETKNHAHAAQ